MSTIQLLNSIGLLTIKKKHVVSRSVDLCYSLVKLLYVVYFTNIKGGSICRQIVGDMAIIGGAFEMIDAQKGLSEQHQSSQSNPHMC